jgi:hypothetical protein
MTFKVTKGGGLQETGAKEIPLAFTQDNLKKLLGDIISETSIYSHQDFTNWASKFHMHCINLFDKGEQVDDELENLLLDIDMQWDLYLFNKYSVDELLKTDLSIIKFPAELLNDWCTRLNSK